MRLCLLSVFLCFVLYTEQKSTSEDDSYVAAVVEYEVRSDVATNVKNYLQLIQDAAEQNADIVVFPEMTLTRGERRVSIPIHGLLKDFPVPAVRPDLYDEILVSISGAALKHEMYVVINVQEVMDCSNSTGEHCPEQKVYLFNTNVVFDRTGAVIDRYRKINLFSEFTRTPALKPDLGIFTTDFGVTFGHFICFDLMFQVPAVQVVEKHNLTDVIFSTMWFSEMPYLTAAQIQEAYAYAMTVNFLAAGANNVKVGSAGSGIYSGKAGALISVMPGIETTLVFVSRVPKVPGKVTESYPGPISGDPRSLDSLVLISDPSLPSHVSRPLVEGSQEFILTDKEVSCMFRVKLQQGTGEQYYRYRAAAFSGVRSFSGMATGGNRICSVIACSGDTIDTCGKRFPNFEQNTTGIFEELSIVATVPTPVIDKDLEAADSTFYPVSLDIKILPLEPQDYIFKIETSNNLRVTTYNFSLNKQKSDLYSFAVWGRVFGTDGEEASSPVKDGSNPSFTGNLSSFLLILVIVAIMQ